MNEFIKPLAVLVVLVAVLVALPLHTPPATTVTGQIDSQAELKKFASESDLKEFLKEVQAEAPYGYYGGVVARDAMLTAEVSAAPQAAKDYSTTNVQIEGVDEADFVKNDGKYIYTISGQDVVIVDAPELRIVSTINVSGVQQLYINGDRLVLFGNKYDYYDYYGGPMPLAETKAGSSSGGAASSSEVVETTPPMPPGADIAESKIAAIWPGYGRATSYIKIYDVSDRSNPVLSRDVVLNGSYQNSRMIGDYVYAIVNSQPYYTEKDVVIPFRFSEVYYFDVPDYSYQFTDILSVNVKDDSPIQSKVFLMGYSSNLFVSQNNIYMVYQKQLPRNFIYYRVLDDIILPTAPASVRDAVQAIRGSDAKEYEKLSEIESALSTWREQLGPEEAMRLYEQFNEKYNQIQSEMAKELEKSVVHKVSVKNGEIIYAAKGEVPGYPLNQFSMDEHNGYFRIATTTDTWGKQPLNHIYVLDQSMNIVGRLEDLAKGERIFSARFMGDRAYMVTFVRIDPLFVIDLSNPAAPAVLGELKIPGVSDYLHPYDDTHIIGIGRSTEDLGERVTFKGLKIAMFDVSDVANPVETAKYEIGDHGTYSDALNDHKAFLFDKERGIMVLPVNLYEKKSSEFYGEFVWQGAYVFGVDPGSFTLKGRVTHVPDTGNLYSYWPYSITRSLYIDDSLYTLSQKLIKSNSLSDLSEIGDVELPYEEYAGPYYIY